MNDKESVAINTMYMYIDNLKIRSVSANLGDSVGKQNLLSFVKILFRSFL